MKKHTDSKLALSKSIVLNLGTKVASGIRTGKLVPVSMNIVPTVCNGPTGGCLPSARCVF